MGVPLDEGSDLIPPGQVAMLMEKVNNVTYPPFSNKDADFIVDSPYNFVDATGGAVVANLRRASRSAGVVLVIKKIDATANNVTITPAGGETVDGAASLALTAQWQYARVYCDGVQWYVVG